MSEKLATLFTPLKVGAIGTLANRILMAPLTRCRAVGGEHVPNALMAEYYAQRASGGMQITEATIVTKGQSAFWTEPGAYSAEQVEGWKKVTSAVHAKGGHIVLQIVHPGRTAYPGNTKLNHKPVAPSAIRIESSKISPPFNPAGTALDYLEPHALTEEEIHHIIKDFEHAAKHAIQAGFDGVEVHAANGYLIDEFLRSSSNKRTDEWGGSHEKQVKFLLSIVDHIGKAIGFDRIGVRISPLNSYNDMKDDDPFGLTALIATKLSERNIAYLHLMRADFFGVQKGDVAAIAREHFKHALVVNMGFTGEEAAEWIASGKADAIAFGTAFLANPDLPRRLKEGKPLNAPDPKTFYSQDAEGYTTYPTAQ